MRLVVKNISKVIREVVSPKGYIPGLLLVFYFLTFINLSYSQPLFRALVFTKTAGFYHSSIPDGVSAISDLGQQFNFEVDHSDNDSSFTLINLNQYDVVIFLNTTGDVLNSNQESDFMQYIQNGGGFVGIHSATDTEYGWTWYGGLTGTYFLNHPAVQTATLNVVNTSHPSTANLPATFTLADEWYNFSTPFPSNLNVLMTVDENTYTGGTMGNFHPVSWYHQYDGGRSFYTAMGHTSAIFSEPFFLEHLLGGIMWAANFATDVNSEAEEVNFLIPSHINEFISLDIQGDILNAQLFNLSGEKISEKKFKNKTIIDVRTIKCGLYILVLTGEKFRVIRKISINCYK